MRFSRHSCPAVRLIRGLHIKAKRGRVIVAVRPYSDHCMGKIQHRRQTVVMPSVLVVDDSAEVRSVVRAFLASGTGFTVCGEATNGLEAIKQAEVLKPDFVLIDLKMPIMNGIETATVLKRLLPKTRIVLFSNYTDEIGTALASAVGIDLVLQKGSLSDMAHGLNTLTDRRNPFG